MGMMKNIYGVKIMDAMEELFNEKDSGRTSKRDTVVFVDEFLW